MQSLKSLKQIPRYRLTHFKGQKLGPNLPICPKQRFFGKFFSSHFCLLIIAHYCAKFQKNPSSGSQDIKLRSFGPKIGTKFTRLPRTGIFWKNSFISFLSTHYWSLWCKVSKKSLEPIVRYSRKYKCLQTHIHTDIQTYIQTYIHTYIHTDRPTTISLST